MQLNHLKNLQPAQGGIARVASACWSPVNKKLAVADHARTVLLFDDAGQLRDKFGLKAADGKEPKTFAVRGMAFSPDSVKLAVAQSDFIIYVYRIGVEFGERKSICNKYAQPNAAITCVTWPAPSVALEDNLVFGTTDGKVKVGLRTNKSHTLYGIDSPVVSLAYNPDSTAIISGHQDGSILRYAIDEEIAGRTSAARLVTHSVAPTVLAWGEAIGAAGNDCKITFYDKTGRTQQQFDYPLAEDKEATVGHFNPSGQTLAVGVWNKLRLFNYNARSRKWEEGLVYPLQNALAITTLAWKCDGSRLVTGTITGAIDTYDACLRRYCLRGAFEMTYVSHNQVIVKRLSTGTRIVLKSYLGYEIQRVNVHKDRFLIANTATTLLLGDLGTCGLSEVEWQLTGREHFIFDNPQVCMVFTGGELRLIEYGVNEVLGTCRTDHTNMHRISVRIHNQPTNPDGTPVPDAPPTSKAIAYLIDRETVQIDDLVTGMAAARIHHPYRIDWLELNHRATKLLMRDKQRQLILYDVASQTKTTLLNFCTYVQWVPDSDVVVAQNRSDMCVWYSIDHPDKVALVPIKGDIEGIERTPATDSAPGKTEVIVDEGVNTVAYSLDEGLIEFGVAMEDRNYDRASELLESVTLNPETEGLWQNLASVALQEMKLYIAERCYAAVGDIAKARALKHVATIATEISKESGGATNGYDHFRVRAELYVLNKEFKRAEQIYLDNGQVDEAIAMWDSMHRYDESIAVATSRNHPRTEEIKNKYYDWLISTKQEERAGELRERDGRYQEAIKLYLKGGVPARAAHVVTQYNEKPDSKQLEAIAAALFRANIYEQAGDFFERLKMEERAIDAYKRGHVYGRAVELARRAFPNFVVSLEEAWGDWLVDQKQVDQAINHYIEANQHGKAIEAAIESRQWAKAIAIIEKQNVGGSDDDAVKGYYRQIATHFEGAMQLPEAEKYYVKGGAVNDAVEMYSRRGMTDHMYRVAQRFLSQEEMLKLFVAQAKQLEAKGDYHGAEQIYIKVNEPDKAIVMYKKARDWANMIRVVQAFHPENIVNKTRLNIAGNLEKEKNYKQAEQYFVAGKDWNRAVNMYREAGMWDDVVRVAKVNGGPVAVKNVVLSRVMATDAQEGAQLLQRFSLVEAGIDAALESQKFELALQWAQIAMPQKLPYVFLKNAMHWEDQGEFRMAEDSFVKAGKPREAIDMYVHQHDFDAAMRVAEAHDPAGIPIVGTAQGRVAFQAGNFKEAEAILLRSNAPETLLKLFQDARMLNDALRIAREYFPDRVQDITKGVAGHTADPIKAGQMLEENGDYVLAIDRYLEATMQTNNGDVQALVGAWTRAVKLAQTHARHSIKDTLRVAVQKLMEAKHVDVAARCLEECEDYKGAITVYCRGEMFDEAEALASRISPELVEYVKREKINFTMAKGNAQARENLDEVDSEVALKAHIQHGEWEKAMKVARSMGEDTARVTAAQYIGALIKQSDLSKALELVARDGVELHDFRYYGTFTQLARAVVMAMPHGVEGDLMPLHDGLYAIVDNMKRTGQPDEEVQRSEAVLQVLHVYATARRLNATKQSDLREQAVWLMASLPRYVEVIPADKAYFDAGMAALRAIEPNDGQEPLQMREAVDFAYIFLNRFTDIADAIDDGEPTSEAFENLDFTMTDYPMIYQLPEQPTISEDDGAEARDWVLAKASETSFAAALPTMQDLRSGQQVYVGALQPPGSSEKYEACAVTGLPVLPSRPKLRCKNCNRAAQQDSWNRFVGAFKQCPWCASEQRIDFTM
eukprot:CAMPEP_0174835280 /NCGR_PEP_ID=MMETSP1114-20130205/5324_1 /TAXON_ID=312471 /ORGANISM="Neobodo designis, Strain CCAP 1951/1" /LENGTH=1775 /DNA_ID=CAMNT_0016069225 /DNA_START=364 /DNA_END=5691 /DNA_ORIENTATION=+